MEAAACGAKMERGVTAGILPGTSKRCKPWIDIATLSGIGYARNALIAQSSNALIVVSGEYGTLSEIAPGLKMGKPVVVLDCQWEIEGTYRANTPAEAVKLALELIEGR